MKTDAPHWKLLTAAADTIQPKDFDEYFELKRLLMTENADARSQFEYRFAKYFGLNNGGLTTAFKKRYFELLFAFNPHTNTDPYAPLLLELYRFPRRKGDYAPQASFVSKLVAIHDESRPLYDRHVSGFFGLSVPSVGPIEFRIAGFIQNLDYVKERYTSWADSSKFSAVTKLLFQKHPRLQPCHPVRICDFLVWTVGHYKIR